MFYILNCDLKELLRKIFVKDPRDRLWLRKAWYFRDPNDPPPFPWNLPSLLYFSFLGLILPVDRDARTLPRQTWIDLCAVLASVLHRDSPQEPAKDRMAPLRPITLRRPSQRLNHQILRENSRTLKNRAKFSLSAYSRLASVKK